MIGDVFGFGILGPRRVLVMGPIEPPALGGLPLLVSRVSEAIWLERLRARGLIAVYLFPPEEGMTLERFRELCEGERPVAELAARAWVVRAGAHAFTEADLAAACDA